MATLVLQSIKTTLFAVGYILIGISYNVKGKIKT